jgi:cytochrome oxidase assembly protein ShyY1
VSILQIALTKRWLGYFAVTVVFAVICSLLGVWQWNRREEAVAAIERIENNYDAAPVSLDEALPDRDSFRPDDEWQPVAVSGEYLLDEQLLVRARPRSGQPGFEVIVPLRLDDGGLVIVNRGWLPVGSAQDSPDVVPAAPSGRVDVVGRIRPSEPTIPGRGAPDGQIATIHLPTIADNLGDDVVEGAYLQLADESPSPATTPLAAARPEINEGPHLSYTFQWYVFALLGFIGFGWAIRQELRVLRAAETGEPVPPPKRRRAGPTDDEEEDALLDAAAR